jgi:splicing factor 1
MNSTTLSRKIQIPQRAYPDYNFLGMIIGPRGMTLKRLQKESGCYITVRPQRTPEEEESHVVVAGPTLQAVEVATLLVQKLLLPVEPSSKPRCPSLWSLRDDDFDFQTCFACGRPGHSSRSCPSIPARAVPAFGSWSGSRRSADWSNRAPSAVLSMLNADGKDCRSA